METSSATTQTGVSTMSGVSSTNQAGTQSGSLFDDPTHHRLGLPTPLRIPITTATAISVGFILGASHGASMTALRYRAENAHRLPKSTLQWYQYHRSKNYRAAVGGLKEGTRLGLRLGLGVACFALFEETCDRARHGHKDFLSTVTAGLTFSGMYSLISRHDIYTTARAAKLGLKASLAYGLVQDVLATTKGNPPFYLAKFFR
ncbi:hypothetical protein KEM54_005324 [Ascosphaera aggregata]|nr:hypothetical protein KEM54_005324 [Ascosphaera aggregata]